MGIKKDIYVLIFAIVALAIGILVFMQGKGLKERCTVETAGTVVEVKVEESIDDGVVNYTYYPVIKYEVGGKTITQKSDSGNGSEIYTVGDKIDILYNPNQAEEFIMKGDNTSDIMGIIFMVVGGILLLVVIGKYVFVLIMSTKK